VTFTTRFAPSPTGRLHVGNIRAALQNYLWARKHDGRFLLRLDDTDAERSTEAFADSIRSDLAWLGLVPDAMVRQSDRGALYEQRFAELRDAGRIYPAYETAQELDLKRKIQLGRGMPPIYDRAALRLSDAERARLEADGTAPHWRFRLDYDAPVLWDDLIRGEQSFDPALLSDPVVRRADGSWLYMLPSVIDDIDLGISHVVRGEDHVANTALQIQMFAAMGSSPPAFAHAPLLAGTEGKLSKRLGSLGVDELRADGIEPIAILAFLARIGTSDPVVPVASIAPLIESFDFSRIGRAPARFDPDELVALNGRTIHQLDFTAVRDRVPTGMDAAAWEAIRPNIASVAEAADWWSVVEGPIKAETLPEDAGFLAEAAAVARDMSWDTAPWATLIEALKARTGRKGKALFLPLRRALTGRDHGPEMAALLPLIGRGRAIARLEAAA
jgi:glutamyl-tRNA synthetase